MNKNPLEEGKPTVCRVVHRVSEAIASLLPDFIHLPVNREECKTVSRKFFNIAGFPKVIGALDGTFVRIISPGGEDAERFRCRKSYFALNVQTIVDADLVIRNVVARWPGSAHDSTVFNNSAACLSLKTNELYRDFHLLGDTGYACEKYLLTPFGNPRTLAEVRYVYTGIINHVLTRNTIERKYGILKRRFPCLSIGLNCNIERVPAIIVACCVLHNLCIRLDDPEPPADPQIEALVQQLELENDDVTPSFEISSRCPAGFAKRNPINCFALQFGPSAAPSAVCAPPPCVLCSTYVHLQCMLQLWQQRRELLLFCHVCETLIMSPSMVSLF
ncbi:nuclease HARBI1 [Trichonephila clavata]|uniref:Nuclease HARBI1 n=1 Tax=Trichonephila clavata TaxID=2740835 RepID=A0A8X6HAN9_TRICU|nr:nuclease HARBI1 [Trichonephila clavata]